MSAEEEIKMCNVDTESTNIEDLKHNIDANLMGLHLWRPEWLQTFKSIKWFLVILSIYSITQRIVTSGLISSSIQAIEKEFGFPSKTSGLILGSYNVASLLIVTSVSFFGDKVSKPKWIGLGSIVYGIGVLLFAVPKLMIGSYKPQEFQQMKLDICPNNITSEISNCAEKISSSTALHATIFIAAQIIMGTGTTPLYTLGPAYLDENVSPRASPIYLGIWFTFTVMGSGIGFVLGGAFLNIYTDLTIPEIKYLTVGHPSWVGAWWLGFLSMGGIFIFTGICLLLFPKQIKSKQSKRDKAILTGDLPSCDEKVQYTFKGYMKECLKMCLNKAYILAVIGITIKSLYISGLGGFVVKLTFLKFGVSEVKASMVLGVTFLTAMATGIMIGACIMRKIKVKIAGKTGVLICAVISFLAIITTTCFLLRGCRNTNLAGVFTSYHNSSRTNSIDASCNSKCDCTGDKYIPICGSDGITYYSPCFAGCRVMLKMPSKDVMFGNCTCFPGTLMGNTTIQMLKNIPSTSKDPIVNEKNATTTPEKYNLHRKLKFLYNYAQFGKCDQGCKNFFIFAIFCVIHLVIGFLSGIPHKILVLRCVPDNRRSFALGMQILIMKIFSFLPSPILLGALVDRECIAWSYDSCGNRKNCLDYDIDDLAIKITWIGSLTAALSTIFYCLSWWVYPVTNSIENEVFKEDDE